MKVKHGHLTKCSKTLYFNIFLNTCLCVSYGPPNKSFFFYNTQRLYLFENDEMANFYSSLALSFRNPRHYLKSRVRIFTCHQEGDGVH